ncbi:MAG: beta-galactosidase trimerization domain-containing protein [Armatimonadota bacterium]
MLTIPPCHAPSAAGTAALRILLACAVCGVMLPASWAADLSNPDFADGIEGWDTWYARQPTTVGFVESETGQALQMLGEEGSRVVVSQTVEVEPERWYAIRYLYQAAPNGPGGGAMGFTRITLRDQNGRFLDYPSNRPLLDTFGRWVHEEQVVRTPLSAGTLSIGFNQSGAADVRIDRVWLEEVEAPERAPNTWERLTSKRAEPLWFTAWQYNNSAEHFRSYGLKYGWRYVFEEQFDEVRESRAIGLWRGDASMEMLRQKDIPAVAYLYFGAKSYRDEYYDGAPPEDIPYMLDPVWHDGYVEACRRVCEELRDDPGLAYIFVQDESYGLWKAGPIHADQRTSTEFWEALDQHIRANYGADEHGLPTGPEDSNPYRWIAYYSWANDMWVDTFGRLREVIDECGSEAKLLGPDEVGFLMPLPWCDLAEYVDVFTGQCLYARGSAQEHVSGWTTKYSRDLTGKPVHNATQVVRYSGCPSPEEVQRQYSEVLQAGGEGQMLIAVEWFDRELNHHRYSAPARWETIKNLLQEMAAHEVQTPGESTVAMLFSSPSAKSLGRNFGHGPLLPLYATLGPGLGAYPTVVDSYAVAKGAASLDAFDLVIVGHMPYETEEMYARLREFVARGGTLICTDPRPLRSDGHGERFSDAAYFMGARAGDARERERTLQAQWPAEMTLRSYAVEAYALRPTTMHTRVVGQYSDGTPAVTLRPWGSGRVIMFGANPLDSSYHSEDDLWRAWWAAVLREHDVPMGLPIWDLRLPDEAVVRAQRPDDVCLTGNAYLLVQNGVFHGANEAVDGSYRISIAPDLWPESSGEVEVAFSEGDLTDRLKATQGPLDSSGRATEEYHEEEWANRWSAEALADGLAIDLLLPEARDLTRLVFWYSGAMGELTVLGGSEGAWTELAQMPAAEAGEDVLDVEAALDGRFDRVRLQFGAPTGAFTLADLELWAEPR